MTQDLIVLLTAVGTAAVVGLPWILHDGVIMYRRGLHTGYRTGYHSGHMDGYHQAEREAAEHLDPLIDEAVKLANSGGDQLAQLNRESGWQLDGTDCHQIEREEKARE